MKSGRLKFWVGFFAVLSLGVWGVFFWTQIGHTWFAGLTRPSFPEAEKTVAPTPSFPGLGPECPEKDCLTVTVNGDILVHDGLWNPYRVDPATNDGYDFDFTELFAPEKEYFDQSDIAICNMETPLAVKGGPYADYPIFNTPPEILIGAAEAGYDACTHATNHSFDRGVEGIERTIAQLELLNLIHAGSYLSEADSEIPMTISTLAGTVAVIPATVSTNGQPLDQTWRVDTIYEHNQYDWDRFIAKAERAKAEGADIIIAALHSIQEYIDYADSWQVETAHRAIDSGLFDLVYFNGSHAVQPIEQYGDGWILYGLGNSVCESADRDNDINNHGLTVRVQFAKRTDTVIAEEGTVSTESSIGGYVSVQVAPSWYISDISWVPSNNEKAGLVQWCSLASDHPDGYCRSEAEDEALRANIERVVYSMSADTNVVREWLITTE
jgi:poly-gamma-glutamate synthesis protein (capsule biosynthesis protein)